jgi:hypothetical protein
MKRPYTKIEDFIASFAESGEPIMEVDALQWMTDKRACDDIRRCIKKSGYKDIIVLRRKERVFVVNLEGKVNT